MKTIILPNKFVLRTICIIIVSISLKGVSLQAAEPGKLIGSTEVVIPDWFKTSFLDFREDAEEAAEDDRHLLIYFHIDGCPYCQKMLDDNFRGLENSELVQSSFDSVELNMHGSREVVFDENKTLKESKLVKALNVTFTPTILFMNADNQIVMRLNGYRSPKEFKQVLNFVRDKAYLETDFSTYRDTRITDAVYTLQNHSKYSDISDIQSLVSAGKPVAILFEDSSCDACSTFHKDVFSLDSIQSELNQYTIVRLDSHSTDPIIDNEGRTTSAKAWLKSLGISYRPSMLLFNEGKKRESVTGLLKSFHFQQLLSYVSGQHYKKFSTWSQFMTYRMEKLIESGKTVDVWK